MPEFQYDTSDLRTGSAHAHSAADSANQAASTLKAAPAGASPFGNVGGADALHGAVGHAKDTHSISAGTASQNMSAQGQRASTAASLGDDNTTETTGLAPRSSKASTVSKGM